jgi:hypothetical protein
MKLRGGPGRAEPRALASSMARMETARLLELRTSRSSVTTLPSSRHCASVGHRQRRPAYARARMKAGARPALARGELVVRPAPLANEQCQRRLGHELIAATLIVADGRDIVNINRSRGLRGTPNVVGIPPRGAGSETQPPSGFRPWLRPTARADGSDSRGGRAHAGALVPGGGSGTPASARRRSVWRSRSG